MRFIGDLATPTGGKFCISSMEVCCKIHANKKQERCQEKRYTSLAKPMQANLLTERFFAVVLVFLHFNSIELFPTSGRGQVAFASHLHLIKNQMRRSWKRSQSLLWLWLTCVGQKMLLWLDSFALTLIPLLHLCKCCSWNMFQRQSP